MEKNNKQVKTQLFSAGSNFYYRLLFEMNLQNVETNNFVEK